MKNNLNYSNVYFLGIGGIGMSALARYFLSKNIAVAGYDKTETALTGSLKNEGAIIQYNDNVAEIPKEFKETSKTLVIYTPAIPSDLSLLIFYQKSKAKILKRSEVLGEITRTEKGLCVAGTHGKTTTASLLTHIIYESEIKCNAFLGGISTNLNSNVLVNDNAQYSIIEADEFDRSFLKLSPFSSIITSCDPDHLDIYKDKESFKDGFKQYSMKSDLQGYSIQKEGLNLPSLSSILTYAINSKTADYSVDEISYVNGKMKAKFRMKNRIWSNMEFGLPGIHNAENALACAALLLNIGFTEEDIRFGIRTFQGVKRRFEYHINSEELVYIDDYAHHPTEIEHVLNSILEIYPERNIYLIFQPHLFSRTKDFSDDFAIQLSRVHELILMPIYPARELPMHGINSEWLLQKIKCKNKYVKKPSEVVSHFKNIKKGIVLTLGAGDIDRIVIPLKEILESNL